MTNIITTTSEDTSNVDLELDALMQAELENENENEQEQDESDTDAEELDNIRGEEVSISIEEETNEQILARLAKMSPEDLIQSVAGSDRGNISKAIRFLISLGASKGTVAKMLNKRYQHVRNVLHNDMLAKQNGKAIAIATPSAPVSLIKTETKSKDEDEDEVQEEEEEENDIDFDNLSDEELDRLTA